MFRPVALFIGLRYTRAKRRNHFISFISMMSMLGIALGVLVLITVLSVMNGFDREIKNRVFSMVTPVTISNMIGPLTDWQNIEKNLSSNKKITGIAPFVNAQAMLTNSGYVQPAMVMGIVPEREKSITELPDKMISGKLSALEPGEFNIILGEELAERLGTMVGEKITVVTPQLTFTPAGMIPRFKRFTVAGIFRAGSGFGFDSGLAFIHLSDAQKLMELKDAVTGLRININDVYAAPQFSKEISYLVPTTTSISNWTETYGPFFHAVSLEKTMMFYILILIIAVAVFNLVCSLVMVVNDKESDIAILRTIGATPRMILHIFIVQGVIIGVIGTILGVVGGVALALNVTQLVNWIQDVFHVQFLSSNIYFVNYLPSELQIQDVLKISFASLLLSLIATLYPAWRASNTEPVEALRYE